LNYFSKGTQIGLGGQCGGIGYNGSTSCLSGLTCFVRDLQYSYCDISCQAGWLCSTTNIVNSSLASSSLLTTTSTTYSFNFTSTFGNSSFNIFHFIFVFSKKKFILIN